MSERATAQEIAAAEARHLSAVKRILKNAGMESDEAGTYDLDEALAALESAASPGHALGKLTTPNNRRAEHSDVVAEYATARQELLREQMRKLQIANDARAGKLIDRDVAAATALKIAADIKRGLEGLGRDLSEQLVDMSDSKAIRRIIDDEVSRILSRLAAEPDLDDDDPLAP